MEAIILAAIAAAPTVAVVILAAFAVWVVFCLVIEALTTRHRNGVQVIFWGVIAVVLTQLIPILA